MAMMTATFSPLDGIGSSKQRNQSVWRQFLDSVIEARTPRVEDEIARYLARHRYDLPPQVWIELERRRFGP
jgi:hypothetical protein